MMFCFCSFQTLRWVQTRIATSCFAVALCCGTSQFAQADPLAPDDPSIEGNLLVWLTDPANTYKPDTGVWLDSSGNGNSAVTFTGNKNSLEFGPFLLEQETPEFGLFAGQDIDVVLSTDADDSLKTPHLNGEAGFGELTMIGVLRYGSVESNNRPFGIGSFHDDDFRPGYQLAGDGSIRRDNGFIAGTEPVPADLFIRASVLYGDGVTLENSSLLDMYFDDFGTVFNIDGDVFDPGNAVTADDRLYLGDLRANFADNAIAQVAFYNIGLSEQQVTGIAEWMTANPNGGGLVTIPGDFNSDGAVELERFQHSGPKLQPAGRARAGRHQFRHTSRHGRLLRVASDIFRRGRRNCCGSRAHRELAAGPGELGRIALATRHSLAP